MMEEQELERPVDGEALAACRLCLGHCAPPDLVPASLLRDRITACVHIQIDEDDGLPSHICKRCEKNVNNWHVFKKICDNAQTQLQNWKNNEGNRESSKITPDSDEVSEDDFAIDASAYPGVEISENGEVMLQNPPILASLGLAPKGEKEMSTTEAMDSPDRKPDKMGKKRPFAVSKLASKDCLLCGRTYRYSHNARRHELTAHGYDRYTNKIKPHLKVESQKSQPNMLSKNQLQVLHQRKELVKHMSMPSPITNKMNELREPLILKSLLTTKDEPHSDVEMHSQTDSEDDMSDHEYPLLQVETVITEEPDPCESGEESEKHYQSESAKEESECEDVEMSNIDINDIIGVQAHDAERVREEYKAKNIVKEEVHDSEEERQHQELEYVSEEVVQNMTSDGDEPSELVIEEHPDIGDEELDDEQLISPEVQIDEHPIKTEHIVDDKADVDKSVIITTAQRDFIVKYKEVIEQMNTMQCHCCSKVHPRRKALVSHLQKYGFKVPRFTCYNCIVTFGHPGALIGHMKANRCTGVWRLIYQEGGIPDSMVVEGEGMVVAEDTTNKSQYKDILNARSYSCKLCSAKFQLKQFIMKHIMDAHESGGQRIPLVCIHCKCKFKDSKMWKKHTRSGECMVYISCDICSEKFMSLIDFSKHALTVHADQQSNDNASKQLDGRPTDCTICGKSTFTYSNLVRHLKMAHSEDRPHMCQHCDNKFSAVSELNHHIFTQHSDIILQNGSGDNVPVKSEPKAAEHDKNEYNYSCMECSSVFATMEEWTQHQINVHEHIAYECDECEMKFLQDSQLIEHKNKQHAKMKLYQCPYCPTKYQSTQKLMEHLSKVHPGTITSDQSTVTPFYCEICVRAFKSRQAFSNHMRIHAKVPTHNRKAGEPKEMVKKIPVTIKSEPSTPKVSSAIPVNPVKKIQRSLPDAPYFCDICGKGFLHKKNIWKHKKILHPEVVKKISENDSQLSTDQYMSTSQTDTSAYVNGDDGLNYSTPQFDSFSSAIFEPEVYMNVKYEQEEPVVEPQVSSDPQQEEESPESNNQQALMYQCDMCDKKFAVRTSIWKHKKLKHGITNHNYRDASPEVVLTNSKITCTLCKLAFGDKKAYYRHRKTVHKHTTEKCPLCGETFTSANSSQDLQDHLRSAHTKELLSFNNEDQVNSSHNSSRQVSDEEAESEEIYESEIQHHAPPKYSCKVCGNSFPGMLSLRTHKCPAADQVISSNETYDCEICHKSYTSISALKSHRGWHLRSQDGKAAFSSSGLWMPQNKITQKISKHEILDTVIKKPMASSSPLTLTPSELKKKLPPDVQLSILKKPKLSDEVTIASIPKDKVENSVVKQTAINEGRYCQQCNREFTKKAAYFRHMEEVHRPNSVFCHVCNKSFTRKSTLLVHMKKHESNSTADISECLEEDHDDSEEEEPGDEYYHCDLCEVEFPSAALFKQHCVKEHDISEDDIVEQDTSRPADSEKQKCEQCGDYFKAGVEMWSHQHHTCDICEKHFSSAGKLSNHTRKRHSEQEKMFLPCSICDRYYMNEVSLQKHMESAHNTL